MINQWVWRKYLSEIDEPKNIFIHFDGQMLTVLTMWMHLLFLVCIDIANTSYLYCSLILFSTR